MNKLILEMIFIATMRYFFITSHETRLSVIMGNVYSLYCAI